MELTNSESIVGQLSEEEQSRLEHYSKQEETVVLTDDKFLESKSKFNKHLNEIQKFAGELYNDRPNKEVYDALISLSSIKNL